LDNRAFHLIHLLRPEESFRTLGDHSYEICIFRRVKKGSGPDNRAIYQQLVNKSAS